MDEPTKKKTKMIPSPSLLAYKDYFESLSIKNQKNEIKYLSIIMRKKYAKELQSQIKEKVKKI